MDQYELYQKYVALKRHFTSSYNYFTYNGKTRTSMDTYRSRKDKFHFNKIAKKYPSNEAFEFLVSNFVNDKNFWIGNPKSENIYIDWKGRIGSLTYIVKNDLEKYNNDLLKKIKTDGNDYPELLMDYMSGDVSLEFMCVTDTLIKYTHYWKRKFKDDPVIDSGIFLIEKYRPFIDEKIDKEKMKKIYKEVLNIT